LNLIKAKELACIQEDDFACIMANALYLI